MTDLPLPVGDAIVDDGGLPPRALLVQVADGLLASAKQSSARLNDLADYLVDAFRRQGLAGLRGGKRGETTIPGFGRSKTWDVSFVAGGKPRLLVSLKSILKNISGTVPNRIDDLMGEAANVQLQFPEIVVAYVAILDDALDAPRTVARGSPGETWIGFFTARIRSLAVRRPPVWGAGLIEACWLIRIDSRRPAGHRLVEPDRTEADGAAFVREIIRCLAEREPTLVPPR